MLERSALRFAAAVSTLAIFETMTTPRRALACVAVASLLAASVARAAEPQPSEAFALDTFEPAPAGDRFFSVQSPDAIGHGLLSVALVTDAAVHPLVLEAPDAAGNDERYPVVLMQFFEHVGASLALWDRVRLSIDVPVGATSIADDIATQPSSTASGAVGDLRGSLRARLLGDPRGRRPTLAVGGYVWLPTGDEDRFAGEGSVRGSPMLVVGGRHGPLSWALNVGAVFRPVKHYYDATLGTELAASVAASVFVMKSFAIGLETTARGVVEGSEAWSAPTNRVETLFTWRVRGGPIVGGPAIGVGMSGGVGTPLGRALILIAYAPVTRPREEREERPPPPPPPRGNDRDRDGVPDVEDACPDLPGVPSADPRGSGCPDADGDGVPDNLDACPDRPGPASESIARTGCPVADRDGDGIPDAEDACPTRAGVRTADPRESGCPADRDGDLVPDAEDACPDEKGSLSVDPRKNGCPREQP